MAESAPPPPRFLLWLLIWKCPPNVWLLKIFLNVSIFLLNLSKSIFLLGGGRDPEFQKGKKGVGVLRCKINLSQSILEEGNNYSVKNFLWNYAKFHWFLAATSLVVSSILWTFNVCVRVCACASVCVSVSVYLEKCLRKIYSPKFSKFFAFFINFSIFFKKENFVWSTLLFNIFFKIIFSF